MFLDRNSARVKRGGLNSSGTNTPVGRGSRSSSVASAHNRKASASAVTPKNKTKLGRGYNPSLVNYKDSEYHYGSDFEDDGEEDNEEQASEHSSDEVRDAFLCDFLPLYFTYKLLITLDFTPPKLFRFKDIAIMIMWSCSIF